LSGWRSKPLDGVELPGFAGGLLELFEPDAIPRLSQQHEAFLRAEAARYGIRPSCRANGQDFFFGEYLALPQAVQDAAELDDAAGDDEGNEE
jgi:hypothetical protein